MFANFDVISPSGPVTLIEKGSFGRSSKAISPGSVVPVRAARVRNTNGPGSNGGISPGSWLEPGLKGRAPLVPVRGTNRD